jgi:hypothetical protein
MHREVWAALTLMRDVKGRSVAVRVMHNGSTLRSSQQAALAHSAGAFQRMVARGAAGRVGTFQFSRYLAVKTPS